MGLSLNGISKPIAGSGDATAGSTKLVVNDLAVGGAVMVQVFVEIVGCSILGVLAAEIFQSTARSKGKPLKGQRLHKMNNEMEVLQAPYVRHCWCDAGLRVSVGS